MVQRRQLLLAGMAASAGAASWPARASQWPTKPVKIIVPNVPGGGIDILARMMEVDLQKAWGQPVIIEYKAGAGTVLGTDFVAKSAPDGHTLGMVVTSHVINPSLRPGMPFNTLKDLTGVTLTARSSILLSAPPNAPYSNLKELIAYAKANPGKLAYATPGAGSAMHLGAELLKQQTGIFMLHIPYRGSGGAYPDVSSGRVDLLVDPMFASMPHVKGGRLKPIAVLSATRDATEPNIPAVGEVIPGFDVVSINGIVVPSATPRELVKQIRADFAKVLATDDMKSRLRTLGLEPMGSTPEEANRYFENEIKRWDAVVKRGNIKLD
jgi:tripartite-type tricarboxylate transporter receptor subunit TctC